MHSQLRSQKIFFIEDEVLNDSLIAPKNEVDKVLQDWLIKQWDKGFLEASVDSIRELENGFEVRINRGAQYSWGSLALEDELGILKGTEELGFRWKPGKRTVNSANLYRFKARAIKKLENNGFPFAQASYSQLEFNGDTLHAFLKINKGPLVIIDSLLVRTDARVSNLFLQNYLELQPGDIYDESLIKSISTRIKEIPYLSESKSPEILFADNKANVYLYLEEQKASFANGVIGLQPDGNTGEITITGQLELKLLNSLKRGELIHINWRKLQQETQDIFLEFNYPYLFKSPIGIGASLKIYRRDSTFSTVDSKAQLSYLLKGGNQLSVFVGSSQSNRLANFTSELGQIGSTSVTSYGVNLNYQKLDYRFNPSKGYAINLTAQAGNKRFSDSLLIEGERILPSSSTQYRFETDLRAYFKLAKRISLMTGAQGAITENPLILENEMFRIGGQRVLRGFDEESIFATSFMVGTAELRYLLGMNSRFFLFFDQAWYERVGLDERVEDQPLGFGTGISFDTKAGIFSLSYALGKAFDNPILIRGAKIHFGFTSLF